MNNNKRFNQYRKLVSLMEKRLNQEVVPLSGVYVLMEAEKRLRPWANIGICVIHREVKVCEKA